MEYESEQFGLYRIIQGWKHWHRTPWFLRLIGKPEFRAWVNSEGGGFWMYEKEMPSTGGINRDAPVYWRNAYPSQAQSKDKAE
jgi:hypothetical protein